MDFAYYELTLQTAWDVPLLTKCMMPDPPREQSNVMEVDINSSLLLNTSSSTKATSTCKKITLLTNTYLPTQRYT
ncbi:hypothetical protein EB796_002928 [Bugula neritina]|uniref:Uncharacterized protein n=1 Tax=Bugula neritina TaxID=10212 RepID=A0A7J7KJ75_BUGNE|nr:hypothetical protein EB796_002928 [Bugula neritina]